MAWLLLVPVTGNANDIFLPLLPGQQRGQLRRDTVRDVAAGQLAAVPVPAALPDGRVAVAVVALQDWREKLLLQIAPGPSAPLGPPLTVADGPRAWHPRLAVSPRGELWIAWCGRRDEPGAGDYSRKVFLRRLLPAPAGPSITVSGPGRACRPDLAIDQQGNLHLAWEQWSAGQPGQVRIAYRRLDAAGRPRGGVRLVSEGSFDRRPALAVSAGGVWLAWDGLVNRCPDGGPDPDYDVFLRRLAGGQWGEIIVADNLPGIQAAPALLADGEALILAYHSSRGHDLVKWWHLRRWYRGRWFEPVGENPAEEVAWRGEKQGGEYPAPVRLPDGRLLVVSRSSQGSQVQLVDGRGISPLFDLTRRGWGSRCRRQVAVPAGDGAVLLGRRGRRQPVLERLLVQPGAGPVRWRPLRREAKQVPACRRRQHRAADGLPGFGKGGLVLYGDIHMHSALSDAAGAPDEVLARAWTRGQDFAALSDHDHIVGRPLFPSQWDELAWLSDVFDARPGFAVLHGFEWTGRPVPAGCGHRNVYFAAARPARPCGFSLGCDDTASLVKWLQPYRALVIPHHTSWTGTDWAADERVERLFEMVSVHGVSEYPGNRPIPPRAAAENSRPAFAREGLARGRVFGFVGGSDAHGLLWHHGQARRRDPWLCGLTGLVAPEVTRRAVFDALFARRTFATSGARLAAGLQANGLGVGQQGRTRQPVKISFRVEGTAPLQGVEIVRDGEVILSRKVGRRQLAGSFTDRHPGRGRHYYYLRAWQGGRPPEMIWTSPVFLDIKGE